MRTILAMLPLLAVLAGCGGEYQLLVPDQLAPAGGATNTVLRLQRNEFAGLMMPVVGAPMQLKAQDGLLVGAYTDKQGYASANVPVGERLGKYHMRVALQDTYGREMQQFVPVYVWDPRMSVVAVEYDAVKGARDIAAVRDALTKIASNAYIIYFTGEPVERHAGMHLHLKQSRLPDGAVMGWQQESWRLVGEGTVKTLVIEDRLVSPLAYLRVKFPSFRTGLCESPVAAKAFLHAGLKVCVTGPEKVSQAGAVAKSWADIVKTGL